MRLKFISLNIFLFFLLLNCAVAQSDRLIFEGLDAMYNLNFKDAALKFHQAKAGYPDDIKGYFYESMISFYTAIATRDEEAYEKFIDLSSRAIKKSDELLKTNRNNTEALFYKGQAHSYRSLLMLILNKSLLRAASNGNDGYRILNAVIKNDPGYYDAYMGLGLYKIAIGFVPGKFQWLLSIIGFNGDIREGVSDLKRAMMKGKFTKIESQVYLAFFSMKEAELQDQRTVNMLKTLLDKYPQSPVFLNLYAGALQQLGMYAESIPYLEKSLLLNTNSLQDAVKKSTYVLLGNAYFRANDFANAIKYFEEHLKYVDQQDRYNVSLFTTGVCYEMLGNRPEAMRYYDMVRDLYINERDGEVDKLFYRYAQKKKSEPVNELDSLLIIGMNFRESGEKEKAKEHFIKLLSSDIPDRFNSQDDRARIFFETGYMYVLNGIDDLAIDYFTRVTNINPEHETWMIPYAYFELGKIYDRRNNKASSAQMFRRIRDFSDYDMQQLLEMRLKNYMENF